MIAQRKKEIIPVDYARILHKQSEVLRTQVNSITEANVKKEQAMTLLTATYDASYGTVDQANEQTYDNQVYLLWRETIHGKNEMVVRFRHSILIQCINFLSNQSSPFTCASVEELSVSNVS